MSQILLLPLTLTLTLTLPLPLALTSHPHAPAQVRHPTVLSSDEVVYEAFDAFKPLADLYGQG